MKRHRFHGKPFFQTAWRGKYRYRYVWAPDHPNAIKSGHIAEHRLVMSRALGRPLTDAEIVHHRNGDTLDNRAENLEVMTRGEHTRIHKPRKRLTLSCATCGKAFERWVGEVARANAVRTYCSRACAGDSGMPRQTITCPCGKSFSMSWAHAQRGRRFCSPQCTHVFKPSRGRQIG